MNSNWIFPLTSVRRQVCSRGRAGQLAIIAALLGAPALTLPTDTHADVRIGITIAPPALLEYAQPPAPAPGYIWTPGYWAWGPNGYYWVDGAWLMPPAVGMLWTPGWWGWSGGYYRWHAGYWGPQVGFYGGINYGFGYFGIGYVGGGWRGNHFYYNRAVTNVNVTNIRNVYVDKTVIHEHRNSRVSYNGGRGGLQAAPNPEQRRYAQQHHQTLPPAAGDRQGASSPGAQRPGKGPGNRPPSELRTRPDTPAHQDARPRQTGAQHPNPRMDNPRPADRGAPPMERPGNRYDRQSRNPYEQARPADMPRRGPPAGPVQERPRRDMRPAAAPERPRQDIRTQEFRPPRAQAPTREQRQSADRPEPRGQGHSRQGREDR